jgi:DNA helicase-2/ATP-dependent DNA helicase PcrA
MAYLRMVHNPNDEVSLSRIINIPPRGIGDKTFLALRTQAQKDHVSVGKLLADQTGDSGAHIREIFAGRSGVVLANFATQFKSWIALKDDYHPLALMDRILEDIDYHGYIDDGTDEGQDRWDNLMELRRLAAEYQEQGLAIFLERVALVSDQDTLVSNSNVPTLLTLHAAKGLEFPVVFIAGLNDGTLPHSRSFDDPEAMMEERRLLYVGITRAKNHLYLLYSQNRSSYGYAESVEPSRFLNDIPSEYLDIPQATRASVRTTTSVASRPERWDVAEKPPKVAQKATEARFRPGLRVKHPSLGDGIVLKNELQDGDEIVDVFFAGIGLKRLMASLANLEVK